MTIEVIAHRGFWLKPGEKNTLVAFKRAFASGFGIETDIRDYKGELVISHDIPDQASRPLIQLLQAYQGSRCEQSLTLNIKADGLSKLLQQQLSAFNIANYFVFDMSVPDALAYLRDRQPVFTRQSEYETLPAFYEQATGVWLDEFERAWIDLKILTGHSANQKKICIVSPELHKRPHLQRWQQFKEFFSSMNGTGSVALCTDFPLDAQKFFNE